MNRTANLIKTTIKRKSAGEREARMLFQKQNLETVMVFFFFFTDVKIELRDL